jgi:hypothetical protein
MDWASAAEPIVGEILERIERLLQVLVCLP